MEQKDFIDKDITEQYQELLKLISSEEDSRYYTNLRQSQKSCQVAFQKQKELFRTVQKSLILM